MNREHDPWDRDRVVVDTAILSVDESALQIQAAVEAERGAVRSVLR